MVHLFISWSYLAYERGQSYGQVSGWGSGGVGTDIWPKMCACVHMCGVCVCVSAREAVHMHAHQKPKVMVNAFFTLVISQWIRCRWSQSYFMCHRLKNGKVDVLQRARGHWQSQLLPFNKTTCVRSHKQQHQTHGVMEDLFLISMILDLCIDRMIMFLKGKFL